MRRYLCGLLALLLLTGSAVGLTVYGAQDSETTVVWATCLRIGLVLGAVWLAFPQLIEWSGKTSPWTVAVIGAAVAVVVVRPRMIIVLGPILLILGILWSIGWLMKPLK